MTITFALFSLAPNLLILASHVLWSISTQSTFTRQEASAIVDNELLPKNAYGERIRLGKAILESRNNNNNNVANQVIRGDDPLTAFTYGEFPLKSLDILLDCALEHLQHTAGTTTSSGNPQEHEHSSPSSSSSSSSPSSPLHVLDVGSGCARLCFYMALSRPAGWQVHGMEVMDALHAEALRAARVGKDRGWFGNDDNDDDPANCNHSHRRQPSLKTTLHLHHGLAEQFTSVLRQANIIFMYSTAMPSGPFLPSISGMLLSREWNELLSNACPPGCIVITTDRAMDPAYGWELLDRFDVPNPEVWESTCFLQRKR